VPRRGRAAADASRQLPIFGAETTDPTPADLTGLLAGPGLLSRIGGTARVSVRVDAAWRVHLLVAELVARGLVVSWQPVSAAPAQLGANEDSRAGRDAGTVGRGAGIIDADADAGAGWYRPAYEVRTAYSSRLNGLARAWPAAVDRLFLDGPRLRLWVAAAGAPYAGGYALGLDPEKDHAMIDAALVRAGLSGSVADGGRCYVITGAGPQQRLAELVGRRPAAAPEAFWPGAADA
jgi:hypothetical protein